MTNTQIEQDITEAAELEGLVEMPVDLVPLRTEKLMLDEQIDQLTARRDEIKDIFGKHLAENNLQGYLLNGKVHARRSPGTRTGVDVKELKAKMPHIYSQFLKVTKYVSIRIS